MNVLHLFMAGLIALVPDGDRQLKIFLVDAPKDEYFLGCLSKAHSPRIIVRMESVNGGEDGCTGSRGKGISPSDEGVSHSDKEIASATHRFCSWPVDRSKILIYGVADQKFNRRRDKRRRMLGMPLHNLPESSDESSDMSWIADMDSVALGGGKILPELFSDQTNAGITAKATVKAGSFQVCHLVEYDPGNNHMRIPLLEFSENPPENPRRYKQGLADEVAINSDMDSEYMTIYRETFEGESMPPINLHAKEGVLDILVLNFPKPLMEEEAKKGAEKDKSQRDNKCSQLGVDFARYYDIIHRTDPGDKSRFIPHELGTQKSVLSEEHQPNCDDRMVRDFMSGHTAGAGPFTRPICAMAIFGN